MKKIIFNGERFVTEKYYGTVRYTYELIRELNIIAQKDIIILLMPRCNFSLSQSGGVNIVMLGYIAKKGKKNRISSILWKYCIFPLYCVIHNCITVDTLPIWGSYNFDIVAIHDCTPERYYLDKSFSKEIEKWSQRVSRIQKKAAQKSQLILTVSENAKKDIVELYGVSPEKVEVIPNAWQHFNRVTEEKSILNKLALKEKNYFFSLGSRLPHKNIIWVANAAKNHPKYKFVVTGACHVTSNTEFEGFIPNNMIFTGYLADEEIKALMHYCKAFIQPSLYEGFGIPPLEAMSVGADCLVSDIPVFREIYENSVWYFDPNDYEHIDLDKIMSSPKDGNELILNKYSWKNSAEKLWEVLKKEREK